MEQEIMRGISTRTSNQHGVVLFIALIVMVVMSLAAIALMRSVDTTTQVIGNLAFRQASMLPANFAIEDAAAGLFGDANNSGAARISDVTLDDATQNYYATHDPTKDDPYGVPPPLQTTANIAAANLKRNQADGAGNTVTYVIERMCNSKAPASDIPADKSTARSWCDILPPKAPPGKTSDQKSAGLDFNLVYYRVTVRVDGPKGTNTVSFAQAMLR
jgi:type IV pilus assembly protein PilX